MKLLELTETVHVRAVVEVHPLDAARPLDAAMYLPRLPAGAKWTDQSASVRDDGTRVVIDARYTRPLPTTSD